MPQKANNVISVDHAIIAKYQVMGHKFEILVDPDLAWAFKEEEKIPIEEILAVEEIYKDAKKGDRISEDVLKQVFAERSVLEIAEKIILEGELQLTTEQRRKMIETKRKKIVTYICKHAINPKTKTPHPPQRIESAMETAKVNIDMQKKAKDQVEAIVKKISPLLPIKLEKMKLAVRLSADLGGKAHGVIQSFGKINKEEWTTDGSWIGLIEIPAGVKDDLVAKLDALTKGKVETKIVGNS